MSPSSPLLLDLSHTCHTQARTGIQRVARALQTTLGDGSIGITHDPWWRVWRRLEPWEHATLASVAAANRRGTHWPLAAKWRGYFRRGTRRPAPSLPHNRGLLVPELFSPTVAQALPELFAQTRGPRIAIFHDAIALRLPEFTPAKTVARFPPYLLELLAFDGIAAVSEDSRDALTGYWDWLGVARRPAVCAVPLGLTLREPLSQQERRPPGPPIVLCVGSIEGRKNHGVLLDACEQLWARGSRFSLHLIGLAHRETGAAALARIRSLQAAGHPLRYDGPVRDDALEAAYAECTCTVYPSLAEGFGLPVLESLAHGKPCVCSAQGALGEVARGGGCLTVDPLDAGSVAAALARLLDHPAEREALVAAARARHFRTWSDYAQDLVAWTATLDQRA